MEVAQEGHYSIILVVRKVIRAGWSHTLAEIFCDEESCCLLDLQGKWERS